MSRNLSPTARGSPLPKSGSRPAASSAPGEWPRRKQSPRPRGKCCRRGAGDGAASAFLAGRRVVVSVGATVEPIDEMRVITNRSSGRMGFAVAEAARAAGADVVAIVGRVNLPPPEGVLTIRAETAARMREVAAVEAATADIFVAAAAVADFRPARVARQKIRRQSDFSLRLRPTEDILAAIAASAEAPFCVGFAAETGDWESILESAREKCGAKKSQ